MTGFQRAYLICSTQRSGSTYLCQLLGSTGTLGYPMEFFEARAETGLPPHPGYFLAGLPRTGAGIRDDPRSTEAPPYSDLTTVDGWDAHLERTFTLGTTPNGVFGAKLMYNQLPDLRQHAASIERFAGLSDFELLTNLFDGDVGVRFVWMRRREKVRQAISLWRALQTRTWRLEHPRPDAGPPVLSYSFDGIEHLRRRLSADDAAWERFFDRYGIAPTELVYEEQVAPDPAGSVRRVAAAVVAPVPAEWAPAAAMMRQSDTLSEEWYDTYQSEAAAQLFT